jgi:hypothetical protein
MQRGSSTLKMLLKDFAKSRDLWPLQAALGIGAGMGIFAIFHTAKGSLTLNDLIKFMRFLQDFHNKN